MDKIRAAGETESETEETAVHKHPETKSLSSEERKSASRLIYREVPSTLGL